MIDPAGNEMKDLNDMAYDWINQTVKERLESSIRLLKIHGFISDNGALKAWSMLKELEVQQDKE